MIFYMLGWLAMSASPLGAQTAGSTREEDLDTLPGWVLYEKGNVAFERKDFGQALYLYQQAIERSAGIFPEAEEAIGNVYWNDGQIRLAEQKYRKALDLQDHLTIRDGRHRLRMKLARLLLHKEDYRGMEVELTRIVKEDPYFADPRYDALRASMLRTYKERGIDALLRAYRVGEPFALQAHAELGWFYYRTGVEQQALLHLLFAADGVAAQAVEELRRVDPEYAFSTLGELLASCAAREETSRLLEESSFGRTLYYLASSAWMAGYQGRAREGWKILAAWPAAGEYARQAARQLESPWIEPRINPSSRELNAPAVP